MTVSACVVAVLMLSTFPSGEASRIAPPRKVKDVKPIYPPESLEMGDEGAILLDLNIDASGTVESARILWSGCHRLDQAALTAVRQRQFKEVRVNEKPVAYKVVAEVPFRLPREFKSREGRAGACRWKAPPRPIQ